MDYETGDAIKTLFGWIVLGGIGWGVYHYATTPFTPSERQTQFAAYLQGKPSRDVDRYLCRVAAACRKYTGVREECATAGSFKICVRIKMGDDADLLDICMGEDGAPRTAMLPGTPNRVECFFGTRF